MTERIISQTEAAEVSFLCTLEELGLTRCSSTSRGASSGGLDHLHKILPGHFPREAVPSMSCWKETPGEGPG